MKTLKIAFLVALAVSVAAPIMGSAQTAEMMRLTPAPVESVPLPVPLPPPGLTPPDPLPFCYDFRTTLVRGSRLPEVVVLNHLLQLLGYQISDISVFGADTVVAVADFQQANLAYLNARGVTGDIPVIFGPITRDVFNKLYGCARWKLQVVSPNGGERWEMNSTQTVKWSYPAHLAGRTVSVGILLYRIPSVTSPVPYINAATGTLPVGLYQVLPSTTVVVGSESQIAGAERVGLGEYRWTIPYSGILSAAYKYRMFVYLTIPGTKRGYSDTSDSTFGFVAPTTSITVTAPTAGETLTRGSTYTITWKSANFPPTFAQRTVNLTLVRSCPAGTVCTATAYPIANNISDSGSYQWTVGKTPTVALAPDGSYVVQVSSAVGTARVIGTSGVFTLRSQPSVTVMRPDGGETLNQNTPNNIIAAIMRDPMPTVAAPVVKFELLSVGIGAAPTVLGEIPVLSPAAACSTENFVRSATSVYSREWDARTVCVNNGTQQPQTVKVSPGTTYKVRASLYSYRGGGVYDLLGSDMSNGFFTVTDAPLSP